MTPRHLRRTFCAAAALAALIAPLAVVASFSDAAAASPKTHHLKTYKVEKQVDLGGEFPDNSAHLHLYCEPGDYALDGMWRVDHVDQANPDLGVFGDERDIRVDASYGDDVDVSEWHFRFVNNAQGANAQLKIFLTCLDNHTEGQNGHGHHIGLSNRFDHHTTMNTVAASVTHPSQCAPDELAVAPGFNFVSNPGRVFRSWPTANFRGWQWAFLNSDTSNVNVYFRCLATKTAASGSGPHAHRVRYTWFPDFNGFLEHLPIAHQTNKSLSCGAQEKGMVGAWWIDDPLHVWFLGMDPRPKIRNYRYWNDGGGSDVVYHGLLCLNTRTGFQMAP